MNSYLQLYLNVRGIRFQTIATATGIGYHTIQKTIRGLRGGAEAKAAIAQYLGLDPRKTWSRNNGRYLKPLIELEANRQVQAKIEARRQRLLRRDSNSANVAEVKKVVNV